MKIEFEKSFTERTKTSWRATAEVVERNELPTVGEDLQDFWEDYSQIVKSVWILKTVDIRGHLYEIYEIETEGKLRESPIYEPEEIEESKETDIFYLAVEVEL